MVSVLQKNKKQVTQMSIKENLEAIEEKLTAAALKSGRKREDILLLGVTKTIDTDRIREMMSCGVKSLGENKVQEIMDKYDKIGPEAQWHLIGHLQTNKVKYIIDKVKLIHSVDSLRLAEEIDKRARQHGITMDVLIEVNIAGEESKHGIRPEDTLELCKRAAELEGIRIKGLMTVAPFVENPQENRDYFAQMKKLFVDISSKNIDNIDMAYLSMGMTNDYQTAVEEGANIVRIGTGIFGKRNYSL